MDQPHVDPERQEALLKELEACQASKAHDNQMAWVIGSIFIGIALVGLLSFSQRASSHSIDQLLEVTGAGVVAISTIWLWYQLYRRWCAFVEVAQRRMQEIERALGLWKNRDTDILDRAKRGSSLAELTQEEMNRLELLKSWSVYSRWPLMSIHQCVMWVLIIITIAWVVLVGREWWRFFA